MSVKRETRKCSQETKSKMKTDYEIDDSPKRIPLQEINQNTNYCTRKKTSSIKKIKNSKTVIIPKKHKITKIQRKDNFTSITFFPEIKECPEEYEESSKKKSLSAIKMIKSVNKKITRFEEEIKRNSFVNQNKINSSLSDTNNNSPSSESEEKLPKKNADSNTRIRITNYIFRILNQHNNPDLFFLSINILDTCISKIKNITENKAVLTGIIAVLIAAKYKQIPSEIYENLYEALIQNKCEKNFILGAEKEVLKLLGPEVMTQSTLEEYVNSFFVEIWINFNEICQKNIYFENIKESSQYLAKIMVHYQYFDSEIIKIGAVHCVLAAYQFVRLKIGEKFPTDLAVVFEHWLVKYRREWSLRKKNINKTVKIILEEYENYQITDAIKAKNLNKYCPLSFLNKCE